MLQIVNLPEMINALRIEMQLGVPSESVFRYLHKEGVIGGYNGPMKCLKYLLNWMWFSVLSGAPEREFSNVAQEVIDRSLAIYEKGICDSHRALHDYFLLTAAIIAGERERMVAAARISDYATSGQRDSFYASICGMMKARVLGQSKMEKNQLERYLSHKGGRAPFRAESRASYQAFVNGNKKRLLAPAQKACEKFWGMLQDYVSPDPLDRDGQVRMLGWSLRNDCWPWPECALLKLAFDMDEMPDVDPFWIPNALLAKRSLTPVVN